MPAYEVFICIDIVTTPTLIKLTDRRIYRASRQIFNFLLSIYVFLFGLSSFLLQFPNVEGCGRRSLINFRQINLFANINSMFALDDQIKYEI